MNEINLSERIDSVAKALTGGNLSKLALILELQPSYLSQVKSGRKPFPKKCDPILRKFNLNPNWIRTGEGDMTIGAINIHGNSYNLNHLQQ